MSAMTQLMGVIFITVFGVLVYRGAAANEPELVFDNSPQQVVQGQIPAPLHWLPVLTSSPLFPKTSVTGVAIPKDVIVKAAARANATPGSSISAVVPNACAASRLACCATGVA